MTRFDPRLRVFGLLALTLIIAGCPPSSTITPDLGVTPNAVSFSTLAVEESIAIFNASGVGMFTWTAREVSLSGDVWVPDDAPHFSIESDDADTVTADSLEGTVSDDTDRVFIIVDRSGLVPGLLDGYGVEISSDAGTRVIPVTVAEDLEFLFDQGVDVVFF